MEFANDQASSRITLDDGTVLSKCDQCRQTYAERNPPQEPPCETCFVDLDKSNEEAARIYRMVQGQVITAGEQIVDLNYQSVKMVMDLYEVKKQRECFERVTRTFNHFLKESRDKQK
jgi:protein-arginine kinase activator protein McsA